jgi:hypothetical protein
MKQSGWSTISDLTMKAPLMIRRQSQRHVTIRLGCAGIRSKSNTTFARMLYRGFNERWNLHENQINSLSVERDFPDLAVFFFRGCTWQWTDRKRESGSLSDDGAGFTLEWPDASSFFHDCTLLDRTTLATHDTPCAFMEERYKGHVIRVTTEKDKGAYPWKPICRILAGASREFIKQLYWPIGYESSDQAEKVGLMISKKWIDAGKPNL